MLTFNNDQKTKNFYVDRLKLHASADEIIQGITWENGKGCAVGCTLHNYNHASYETELGIPRILAKLEDRIFEGMSNEKAKLFPLQFLEAVPVGVNLKDVYKKFFIWMLTDAEHGVIRFAKTEQVKFAIKGVSDLLEKSLLHEVPSKQFIEVRNAAAAAADAAAYADADAARKNHFYIMGQKLIQLISEPT